MIHHERFDIPLSHLSFVGDETCHLRLITVDMISSESSQACDIAMCGLR